MNTETLALQTQIENLLDRNKRLTYALDCLVYVVGLTAVKHESQIPTLQEALNIALETLKYKPIESCTFQDAERMAKFINNLETETTDMACRLCAEHADGNKYVVEGFICAKHTALKYQAITKG